MGKTLKYVSEFSFPSDKGYSGSAGKQMVKGYARGGSCGPMKKADGGKVDRLKGVIGNERKEMMRVEDRQRDAGQELARVRSEMRYDKNEMKGARKQYPTNRSEPMIAMKKGGAIPAPKKDMLYSKKEVNAKNLLRDGKAPPLPHAKGSVNMKSGGPVKKAMGGAMPAPVAAAPAGGMNPFSGLYGRPSASNPPPQMPAMPQRQPAPGGMGMAGRPAGTPMPSPDLAAARAMGMGPGTSPLSPTNTTPDLSRMPSRSGQPLDLRSILTQMAARAQQQQMPAPKPGQVGSATGAMPNIGGFPSPIAGRPAGMPMPSPDLAAARAMGMGPGTNPPSSINSTPNLSSRPPTSLRRMAKGGATKVGKVMGEFKEGKLHSGSKSGPVVKSRKQAIAIGISEARKAKK